MHEMWGGGGRKKIGLYDLIEIKRATARINRRAWRLGYEGMYSAERRVADFCSRLIKAGGANISHASGGGALRPLQPRSSPGSASPPTYENVTPPTDGTLAVSNVNLLIQLCVFTIWSLQRGVGGGGGGLPFCLLVNVVSRRLLVLTLGPERSSIRFFFF